MTTSMQNNDLQGNVHAQTAESLSRFLATAFGIAVTLLLLMGATRTADVKQMAILGGLSFIFGAGSAYCTTQINPDPKPHGIGRWMMAAFFTTIGAAVVILGGVILACLGKLG